MPESIEVTTSFGKIIVDKSADPQHPGLWISLIDPEGHCLSLSGVEETTSPISDKPILRTVVWGDEAEEDPTHIIEHKIRD